MVRVGTHYVEPRRIGFFVAEAALLWGTFVAVAGVVARLDGKPQSPTTLAAHE